MNLLLFLHFILVFLFSSCFYYTYGQKETVTYYNDIEPIIHKNCSSCHHPNGPGPFQLLTYDDVSRHRGFIGHVTKTRYMPPWRADPEFQTYSNERILNESEIEIIQTWIAQGSKKGKKEIRGKYFFDSAFFQIPDLVLEMDQYPIPTQEKDDFRFFNLPTNLEEDQFVTRIEFIPGNKRLVHHSRLMVDTTHKVRGIHGMSSDDPKVSGFEKYPPVDKFFYGWVPGNFSTEFPSGTGKRLFKNSDIILNIHYAPNAKLDQFDKSKINLYFAKEAVDSEVYSLAIAEESISNPPFFIPANKKKIFYSKFGPLPTNVLALAVLPHMHYLGKSFKAFAITPDGDAVFLVKINDWDFNWQETYWFKERLSIPLGSYIFIEAEFDNTDSNPRNPSSPPIDVTYGWNTTSEMLDMVIYYIIDKK